MHTHIHKTYARTQLQYPFKHVRGRLMEKGGQAARMRAHTHVERERERERECQRERERERARKRERESVGAGAGRTESYTLPNPVTSPTSEITQDVFCLDQ